MLKINTWLSVLHNKARRTFSFAKPMTPGNIYRDLLEKFAFELFSKIASRSVVRDTLTGLENGGPIIWFLRWPTYMNLSNESMQLLNQLFQRFR